VRTRRQCASCHGRNAGKLRRRGGTGRDELVAAHLERRVEIAVADVVGVWFERVD
jgi:mono/diheme cytochrome c family protein